MSKAKNGVIQNLQPIVIALVSIGITLAIAFLIMAEISANATVAADGNATAAVDETVSAMADIPGWLPIIVITVIGSLLLGLVAFFRSR
jgi:nitrogen fixation/metabolism regulation signal transduction histidine kinase